MKVDRPAVNWWTRVVAGYIPLESKADVATLQRCVAGIRAAS